MDQYRDANRRTWNEWTRHHVRSAFYDVEGFRRGHRKGRAALDAMEKAALGDVAGKSLLHLQCHFGLDTLFWAREEAIAGAGLRMESLHEYPFAAWPILPWLEARPDGLWQVPGGEAIMPLMFALKATKPPG